MKISGQFKVYFNALNLIHNPRFFTNVSAYVYNDFYGGSRCDMLVTVIEKLIAPKMMLSVKVKPRSVPSFGKEFMKISVDSCKFDRGGDTSFILRFVLDSVKDFTNYTFSNPVDPGTYHCTNASIDPVMNYVPPHIISMVLVSDETFDWRFEAVGKIRAKGSGKKLLTLYTAIFDGTLLT